MQTSGKDYKPFWDDSCEAISSHLLSHTQIDSADLESISSGTYLSKMVEDSWFLTERKFHSNKNSQKTYSQSYMSSLAECEGLENTQIKSRKIRIYPTQQQKVLFKQWFGVARKFYNETLTIYKNGSEKTWDKVYKDIAEQNKEHDYIKSVPYQIKKIAVKDYRKALSINKIKAKRLGKPFEMKFRSKKNPKQSCFIPKAAISSSGIYHTIAGKLKMKERAWFESEDIKACRLTLEFGKWFIVIPKEIKITPIDNQEGVVAIDPGVRTFATYFSTEGYFGKLGRGAFDRLLKLNLKIDKLISKLSKETDKNKKSNIKRSIFNIRFKIRNLIDELHWKVIKFFTSRFKVIIFPPFNVSEMAKKSKRKLPKKVVRSMNCFRFYEFKERLKLKCKENGVTFIESSEAFTSKTNSFTGELMENLGSKENFMFNNVSIDRDINGARNILIWAMRDASA
nr:MAG TPA: endonuclease [Caudoviricetes sp.]